MDLHRSAVVGSCVGLVLLGALLLPATATSQEWSRLSVRGELGVGRMLPDHQVEELGLDLALMGAARLGIRPFSPMVLQASFASWYFPSDEGAGQIYSITGGVRVEPRTGRVGWLWLDGNFGVGFTGGLTRFTLDTAAGYEFAIGEVLGLGPFARYGHTFADESEDFPSDAQYIVAGVSITLRGEEKALEGRDTDADGVLDANDICPTVPQGASPDPQRLGCPLTDTDGDGVWDRFDVCPTVPQGAQPDPNRTGCPSLDTDGDGVLDAQDQCPTTHHGENPDPERPGCPLGDLDGDGVVAEDQCPKVHHGINPDPARPGCPAADRDRDSVIDNKDACPDEPGAPNPDPAKNGCPGLALIKGGEIKINQPVFFATDKDTILDKSRPVLQAVADVLRATPQIKKILIEGHTDDRGSDNYNMDLSWRRATNVREFLIQAGVEASRMEVVGFGEDRPRMPGTSKEARAANRRVQFRITDPPDLQLE